MPRGWFSGPGIGVLDARYLMLDCTNDPLTAGLEVNAATAGEPVLILQTTDDNAANPILEIQNAAGAMLSEIESAGNLNFVTALAANPGIIEINDTRFFHNYGTDSLFIGLNAGNFTFGGPGFNIGIGTDTLSALTTGDRNVAIGTRALWNTTTGQFNMAIGATSLATNTIGTHNVGVGIGTLLNNLGGGGNVAVGSYAMQNNTAGGNNTAIGGYSLFSNTWGWGNVAIGATALNAITGMSNIGIGQNTGLNATGGSRNIFIGEDAGRGTAGHTKNYNVMIGYRAGFVSQTADNNVLIGYQVGDIITTGDNNIIIGYDIDPTGAAVSSELNIGDLIYGKLDTNRGGVNVTPPSLAATWHVDQLTDDAAIPVLLLDQADLSEEFIEFTTTVGAGNPIDTAAHGAYYGKVRVMVTGVGYKVLALYEEA